MPSTEFLSSWRSGWSLQQRRMLTQVWENTGKHSEQDYKIGVEARSRVGQTLAGYLRGRRDGRVAGGWDGKCSSRTRVGRGKIVEAVYQSSKKGCYLSRLFDIRAVCLRGRFMGSEKTGSFFVWVAHILVTPFYSGKGSSDRMGMSRNSMFCLQCTCMKVLVYCCCRSFLSRWL